ncbi:MAG: hypothetical protein KME16_23045 [Scytolyngbya sp. HA4215-MV1]|nr:hypothetical protein [Scytolyngbya sp. HA4215-MV1]
MAKPDQRSYVSHTCAIHDVRYKLAVAILGGLCVEPMKAIWQSMSRMLPKHQPLV